MRKILLRWSIALSGLYMICHVLFDFNNTRILRILTNLIDLVFWSSILLYLYLREKEKKIK